MITADDRELLIQFGKNMRKIRTDSGKTLRDVAAVSGVNNSKISKIEKGKINITVTTLVGLAGGLGVLPEDLVKTL